MMRVEVQAFAGLAIETIKSSVAWMSSVSDFLQEVRKGFEKIIVIKVIRHK
jgi:hypothetical protein